MSRKVTLNPVLQRLGVMEDGLQCSAIATR
jgi:hypothetical protein